MKTLAEKKEYNRVWMKNWRAKEKEFKWLKLGKCPECQMLLDKEYEKFHKGCPYYENIIHAKVDTSGKMV